jgi:cellobiose phosphorylase
MEEAMNEVHSRLVRENEGLILLFTPPFGDGQLKPGYIKGYVPGVRENGGQYTHASCWVIQAMALLGRGDTALNLFQLINPINHSRTPMECSTYKTEPYSLAADVYSVYPHTGRGGWTWYTGAAAWLHRVCVENILGLRRHGDSLRVEPCIPRTWREFDVTYRHGSSTYCIRVRNPQGISIGVAEIQVDGRIAQEIELADDGKLHKVEVLMGT